jgi:hypothetical protein
MRTTLITTLFLGLTLRVWAQGDDPTFTEDIAPIIYQHCTKCHREGEIGPMPLTNYAEVSGWAPMIEYVTSIRYMPPWSPDQHYSEFLGERFLTDEQIDLIADWVAVGAPEGPPEAEPALPVFPTGSQVGQPDTVISFARSYEHAGNNQDQYQVFVLPTGLTEDKVLKSIELRPGNPKIVHHALFALDTTGEGQLLDDQSAAYGYTSFGGFGVQQVVDYPGYVPGNVPRYYPEGIGQPIYAGSDLLVQMHYAPGPVVESDSSSVNLFFARPDEGIERMVETYVMLPFEGTLVNGPFIIPPNAVKTFHGTFTVPIPVSMLGIAPHMHLLGKDWTVYAVSPQGDTTNLIHVPEWDFNWQGAYFFKQMMVLEAGSVIHAFATYDNTADNPLNPNQPPTWMSWGERTSDEMFYLPFLYVPYQLGDEDLVFTEAQDSSGTTGFAGLRFPQDKLYPPFPNPANERLSVGFSLARSEVAQLDLLSLTGQLIRTVSPARSFAMGSHRLELTLNDLAPGIYLLRLRSERTTLTQKVVVY